MTLFSCPNCQHRFQIEFVDQDPPSQPPEDAAVAEWIRSVPPGLHRSRDLLASYRADPSRPPLGSPQLGRRLGRLGYRRHQTSQARYWEITAQAN